MFQWYVSLAIFAAVIAVSVAAGWLADKKIRLSDGEREGRSFLSREHTVLCRGAAVICVVICHFFDRFYGGSVTYFTPLGGTGVAVFLILSGYGLMESYKTGRNRSFWAKRLIGVFIPYALYEIITLWCIQAAMGRIEFSLPYVLLDVTCLYPRLNLTGYGWYLRYLLGCYLLFYICMLIPKVRDRAVTVCFAVAVAVFFCTEDGFTAEQVLSFTAGLALSKYREAIPKIRKVRWMLALLATAVAALALKHSGLPYTDSKYIVFLLQTLTKFGFAAFLIYFLYFVGGRVNLSGLSAYGGLSYEIYLTHGLFLLYVPKTAPGVAMFLVATAAASVLFRYGYGYVAGFLKKRMIKKET